MNYDIKESGERIRQLRIQKGFTQEKIAHMLNIDQSNYGRIETGKRGCPVDIFIQLSDLFGVSLDYLIKGRLNNLLQEPDTAQLRASIEALVVQLKQFEKYL
ncbi:MAG: helix-turn-helix transcriptional regulator [Oscillibacter sp.]|nr:helix-turn-helix transcriptional regulator [Oscillibacter sp.]